jgi:hypothetical protein
LTAGECPRFIDVSDASGLPIRGMTSGVVVVDLDGDGRKDLLLGRHAGVPEGYLNQGKCRFAGMDAWGAGMDFWDHHATVVDDLDKDGHDDFYFVVGAHRGDGIVNNALYLSGDGFSSDAAGQWGVQDPFGRGRGGILLDLNGDALQVLVVLNYKTAPRAYQIELPAPMRDRAGVIFQYPVAEDAEVASAHEKSLPTSELRYRSEYMHELLPQDVDNDGKVDILTLGGPSVRLQRFIDGVFRADLSAFPPEVYVPAPVAATWGDFDNDGFPDLYLAYGEDDLLPQYGRDRRNRLLFWRDGRFEESADSSLAMGGSGRDCAAADLDNNGALDLVILQTHRGRNATHLRVLLNDGTGSFMSADCVPSEPEGVQGIADGILIADLDTDGDLDLISALGAIDENDPGGGVRLYRNDLGSSNWLRVILEDRANAVPYGARVEIVSGSHIQSRQFWPACINGSAFRSPLHFGLGRANRIDRLTV